MARVKIKSVNLITNGADNIVSPGSATLQQVGIWVYPPKYTSRIEVRTCTDSDAPLFYRDEDGSEKQCDKKYRDADLSTSRARRTDWYFDFELEHKVGTDSCESSVNHEITTHALSAQVVEYPRHRLPKVPRIYDTRTSKPRCE